MYMNGIPPSPPIKKTPLVGVFFIGVDGEPLEISASRKGVIGDTYFGAACPERSEEVQCLSISATEGPESNALRSVRVLFLLNTVQNTQFFPYDHTSIFTFVIILMEIFRRCFARLLPFITITCIIRSVRKNRGERMDYMTEPDAIAKTHGGIIETRKAAEHGNPRLRSDQKSP